MAELLIIINPNASNREAGDVCVVKEDGWPWSEMERKQFAVVRVPLTVEEASSKYLEDGVPQAEKDAHMAAIEAFRNGAEKNKKALKLQVEATLPNPANYPHRKVKIDTTKLPTELVDTPVNTKAALLNVHAQAKASARAEVEAEIIKKNGVVTDVEKQLKTIQLLEVTERNEGDIAKDKLIEASRRGRMMVIKPILDAIPLPEIKVLTKVELDDMTIIKP